MVRLTRLNHREIAINCDLIEWVEANPDTTVRMISGESILVLEEVSEVIRRIVQYRRRLLVAAGLSTVLTAGSRPPGTILQPEAPEAPGGGTPSVDPSSADGEERRRA